MEINFYYVLHINTEVKFVKVSCRKQMVKKYYIKNMKEIKFHSKEKSMKK